MSVNVKKGLVAKWFTHLAANAFWILALRLFTASTASAAPASSAAPSFPSINREATMVLFLSSIGSDLIFLRTTLARRYTG